MIEYTMTAIAAEDGAYRDLTMQESGSADHPVKETEACRNGNDRPVFVYGTLMRGERAHHMLAGSEFGGCWQLKDYAMYNLGDFPGIKRCKGEAVLGELFFVDAETIARIMKEEQLTWLTR